MLRIHAGAGARALAQALISLIESRTPEPDESLGAPPASAARREDAPPLDGARGDVTSSGAVGHCAAAVAARPDRSALLSIPSHLLFWVVAGGGLALDLWSKDWAFRTMGQLAQQPVVPRLLEFQTMLNPGALFGIGRGQTELFLAASLVALGLVLWMFAQSGSRRWVLHIALAAILAGALGNMYDRAFVRLTEKPLPTPNGWRYFYRAGPNEHGAMVLREFPPDRPGESRVMSTPPPEVGFVRDFIKIPTKIFGERDLWPWVFNVADTLLVIGVGILALRLLFERRGPHGEPRAGSAAEGDGDARDRAASSESRVA